MHDTRTLLPRRRVTGVALAGALLALTACSSSGGGGGSSATTMPSMPDQPSASASGPAAGPDSIVIKNFAFSPAMLSVHPGATVKVTNEDSTAHTLTAADSREFDTGTLDPGKSATFTAPAKIGTYSYICTIHQFMKGTLTVA